MKKIFSLFLALFISLVLSAQDCAIKAFSEDINDKKFENYADENGLDG